MDQKKPKANIVWEVGTNNQDDYDPDWEPIAIEDLEDAGLSKKEISELKLTAELNDRQYEDEEYTSFYLVTASGPVELIKRIRSWLRDEGLSENRKGESVKSTFAKKAIAEVVKGKDPVKVMEQGELAYQPTATDRVRSGKIPTDIIDKVVAMVKSDEGDFAEIKGLLKTWASETTQGAKSNGVDDTGEMELAYAKLFRAVAGYFDQPW